MDNNIEANVVVDANEGRQKLLQRIVILSHTSLFIIIFVLTVTTKSFSTVYKSTENLAPIAKLSQLVKIGDNVYIQIKSIKIGDTKSTLYFHIINANDYDILFPHQKLKIGYRIFYGSKRSQIALKTSQLMGLYEVPSQSTVIYRFEYHHPAGSIPTSAFCYFLDYNKCAAQVYFT